MNLFPKTPYVRMPSIPKPTGPTIPKLSMGMGRSTAPKMGAMPKMTMPKSPTGMPSLKQPKALSGPTASQRASTALFKSAQPKKMAVIKGAIAKLKTK